MIDLKVTKERLKNHLHYGKWGYIIAIALVMVIWNFVFSATEPQTPREYKVDIVIVSYASGDMEGWGEEILKVLPEDQEEVNVSSYAISGIDDAQLYEILAARMAAQEGDVFIMTQELYTSLASGGAFIPLDTPLTEGGVAFLDTVPIPEGYDLETLRVEYEEYDQDNNVTLADAICGVPLDDVQGLLDLMVLPEGMVASVTSYSINQENALTALRWIIENKRQYEEQ